jgi:PAS domain S-box-containing protein
LDTPEQPTLDAPAAASQPVIDGLDGFELAKTIRVEEFRDFVHHTPVAIVVSKILHSEPRLVFANDSFDRLLGRAFAEIGGRGWSTLDAFTHEDDPQLTLGRAVLAGEEFLGTFHLRQPPKPLVVQAYSGIIKNDDGTENYRIAALIDVTERERAQREEFERHIRDKDFLLKEIQHRVKNNLQIITALIRFEARCADQGDRVNLDRLAGRIESLKLLYQALSPDAWGEDIDLGFYLSQIASAIVDAHAVDGIRLDLTVDHAPVSIDVAMPIGLAVNELMTNAFKYAFAGREHGIISLQCLRTETGSYQVIVADDGVGLPEGGTWPVPNKLGPLIVQTLREIVNAHVDVQTAPGRGTQVKIDFAYKAPRT